ncbi:MAG TPA: SOS response-associated peptidase family protein [Moraxellaceae bacterium]|nr:SOS response-associated peptidase family protein [Moraxellaceae bacterium]
MCNNYEAASAADIARQFGVGMTSRYHAMEVYPRSQGWFIRRDSHAVDYRRELVQGQWGLIPWFAKAAKLSYSTNNARAEELEAKASYKQPWARSQRCLIPVAVFWEPCWESGRNVWWSFRRADGDAFALAGLWNTWVDRDTGELHESYTMLTLNGDTHPLFNRMHKPDPARPADDQDKRMVVVLEPDAWDAWLTAPPAQARSLIHQAPASVFLAQPDPERKQR